MTIHTIFRYLCCSPIHEFYSVHVAVQSVTLFISFENLRKYCEGSHLTTHNWHAIHMGKQLQVSNYKKNSNWIPVIGHPCDSTFIMWQTGAWRTNHK